MEALTNMPLAIFQLLRRVRSGAKFKDENSSFKSSANAQGMQSRKILGRSLIKVRNSRGASTDPWGTSLGTGRPFERCPAIFTT